MLPVNSTDTETPIISTDRADVRSADGEDRGIAPDADAERPTGSVLTAKELRVLNKSLKKHEAAYRYLGR